MPRVSISAGLSVVLALLGIGLPVIGVPVWFGVALVVAAVVVLVITFWPWISRLRIGLAGEDTNVTLKASFVSHQNFRIVDAVDERGRLEGRTFEDCHIKGPAVLGLLDGIVMVETTFQTTHPEMNDLYVEIETGRGYIGIIPVKDVAFRRCTFESVGIAGTSQMIQLIDGEMGRVAGGPPPTT